MFWPLIVALSLWTPAESQSGAQVPAVGSDYNDRASDGSYRFGFQTGDEGNHYHTAVGSKDNQVAGRFGSRDASTGRVVETQYTAGRRGFRARGPNIARKMDLSQNKIPYNPPVNPDSPDYKPTLDGYHDPNEDPSYSFGFRTPTYTRKETADSRGRVDGAYSFLDDVGERHDVSYEAGAKIGYNVKTPFPDSKPFAGLFYRGAPSKPGSKTSRGKTSIQQRNDGSYRFVSSGPDQRRTEASDSSGNVRGSYTYIDDKGQQRTVEYIAGPNIGYRIVNKGIGSKFPPPPFLPSSGYPYPTDLGPFPDRPLFTGPDDNLFSGLDNSGGSDFGGTSTFKPSTSDTSTNRPTSSSFGQGGSRPGNSRPDSSRPGSSRPSTSRPGSSRPDGSNSFEPFGQDEDLFGPSTQTPTKPTYTSTFGTTPSPFPGQDSFFGSNPFPPTSSTPFPTYPSSRPPTTSTPFPSYPSSRPPTTSSPFAGYPSGRPPTGSRPFPSPGRFPNNCCKQSNPTTQTPARPSDFPLSAFPEDDPSRPSRPSPSFDDGFLEKPFSELPPKFFNGVKYLNPKENKYKPTQNKDDSTFLSTNRNYYGFPSGVPVRAHVQSLDIQPSGSRIPPPGFALEHNISNHKRR